MENIEETKSNDAEMVAWLDYKEKLSGQAKYLCEFAKEHDIIFWIGELSASTESQLIDNKGGFIHDIMVPSGYKLVELEDVKGIDLEKIPVRPKRIRAVVPNTDYTDHCIPTNKCGYGITFLNGRRTCTCMEVDSPYCIGSNNCKKSAHVTYA